MRRGLLSDYFDGVAVKRLSAVEANVLRSNQHEFNSSKQLKRLLGTQSLHATYRESQRGWLMTLGNFVELVKERQRAE
jgi:hypothetical protein